MIEVDDEELKMLREENEVFHVQLENLNIKLFESEKETQRLAVELTRTQNELQSLKQASSAMSADLLNASQL